VLGVRKDLEVVATEEDLNGPELVIWPAHSTPRHPRKLGGHSDCSEFIKDKEFDWLVLWTSRMCLFSCFQAPLLRRTPTSRFDFAKMPTPGGTGGGVVEKRLSKAQTRETEGQKATYLQVGQYLLE